MSITAAVMLAVLMTAAGGNAAEPNLERIGVEVVPLPEAGTVYRSILAHSNGKVYVALSHPARMVEFDPKTKAMKVVARLDSGFRPHETQSDLRSVGEAVRTALFESRDGLVYGGLEMGYLPFLGSKSPPPAPGSAGWFFTYDTKKVEIRLRESTGASPVGIAYDEGRNTLYALTAGGYLISCVATDTYPAYRAETVGLATSEHEFVSRYLSVVKDGRVYTADGGTGDIRVYRPDEKKFDVILGLTTPARSPDRIPSVLRESPAYKNNWTIGARSPDGMHLFTTAQRSGRLTELDATQGKWGVIIDHGQTVPWAKKDEFVGPVCDAMVFGKDGVLYHTVGPQVLTYNPKTGEVRDLGRSVLASDEAKQVTLEGGTCAKDGVLYFSVKQGEKYGVAVLDPARVKEGTLLRKSPRVVLRPLAERGLKLP